MGLIFARVACRSPQWVLSLRRCVSTAKPYITVGPDFISVLSLVLITSTYLVIYPRGVMIKSSFLSKQEGSDPGCLLSAFRVSECSALNSI